MSSNISVAMKNTNAGTRMSMYVVLHGTRSKRAQTGTHRTPRCLQDVQPAAQITLVKVQDKASFNIQVLMNNIKEGRRMFMYFVLHGIARIPVGKAQVQAQNEPRQTLIEHQGK